MEKSFNYKTTVLKGTHKADMSSKEHTIEDIVPDDTGATSPAPTSVSELIPSTFKISNIAQPNDPGTNNAGQDIEEEEEVSGSATLPLSRVKKIFKIDPEYFASSETAVFSTAVATELFIHFFTEQASLMARSDKRKKLQYKDFANAVSSIDQLFFLSDTIPKTVPIKDLIRDKKIITKDTGVGKDAEGEKSNDLPKGQQELKFGDRTLSKADGISNEESLNNIVNIDDEEGDDDDETVDAREETIDAEDAEDAEDIEMIDG